MEDDNEGQKRSIIALWSYPQDKINVNNNFFNIIVFKH